MDLFYKGKGRKVVSVLLFGVMVAGFALDVASSAKVYAAEKNKVTTYAKMYNNQLPIETDAFVDSETGKINVYCNDAEGESIKHEMFIRVNDEKKFSRVAMTNEVEPSAKIPSGASFIDVYVKETNVTGSVNVSQITTFEKKKDTFEKIVRDSDKDGIPDGYEIRDLKTDPKNADTDNDGFSDGYECLILCTNPLKKNNKNNDSDKDGVTDYNEMKNGTNPYLSDTDFDGINDKKDKEPLLNTTGKAKKTSYKDVKNIPTGFYDVNNATTQDGVNFMSVTNILTGNTSRNTSKDLYSINVFNMEGKIIACVQKADNVWTASTCTYDGDTIVNITNNSTVYSYEYNKDKELVGLKRNGVLEYTIKGNDKKSVVNYTNGSDVTVEYNKDGKVSSMKNDGAEYNLTYDKNGNLIKSVNKITKEVTTYSYDKDNKVISSESSFGNEVSKDNNELELKVNDKTTNITYTGTEKDSIYATKWNGVERVKDITDYYTFKMYQKNVAGKKILDISFNKDECGTTTAKINNDEYVYTYNDCGEPVQVTKNGKPYISYVYGTLEQLTEEYNYEEQTSRIYNYDSYGNILSAKTYDISGKEDKLINKKIYTYDKNSEYLTMIDGKAVAYDTNGNMTAYAGNTLEWSGKTLQSVKTATGDNVEYEYDCTGARSSKKVNGVKTTYVNNGKAVIGEYTDTDTITYIYDSESVLSGMNINGTDYFYVQDYFGSVIKILDTKGNEVVGYEYDAWGNVINVTGDKTIAQANPFRYRSYYYDKETGLYYLNNRYYDSSLRRFISSDTILENTQELAFRNGYVYCTNNPVVHSDYTGNWVATAGFQLSANYYVVGALLQVGLAIDGDLKVALTATLGASILIGMPGVTAGLFVAFYPGLRDVKQLKGAAISLTATVGYMNVQVTGGLSIVPSMGNDSICSALIQGNYNLASCGLELNTGVTFSRTWCKTYDSIVSFFSFIPYGTGLTIPFANRKIIISRQSSNVIKVYTNINQGMYLVFNKIGNKTCVFSNLDYKTATLFNRKLVSYK